MKKLIIIALVVFSISTNAQVRVYNATLKDTSKNIFYLGIENKLIVETAENINIYTDNATIIKIDNNTYFLLPKKEKLCNIYISLKNKEIITMVFNVKVLPNIVYEENPTILKLKQ